MIIIQVGWMVQWLCRCVTVGDELNVRISFLYGIVERQVVVCAKQCSGTAISVRKALETHSRRSKSNRR